MNVQDFCDNYSQKNANIHTTPLKENVIQIKKWYDLSYLSQGKSSFLNFKVNESQYK